MELKKVIIGTIGMIAFVLLLLHIVFFRSWQNYIASISKSWIRGIFVLSIKNSSVLFTGAICVTLVAFLLYHTIKAQVNKGIFKRVSTEKFEIEIFEGSDDSYFDKYLNEVLYLFDQCGADVIVFEDMDRYNANSIFERLREVNALINAQRSRASSIKPLRFFYLLRDDIFDSKDRTKFFDFIIPVVPVVDSSNSYDQFIKHLTESDVFKLFDEAFLQGLSLYIDDMRILKNICNEFLIYNSRLNTTELNHNKLMAVIAYKNLFPRDFGDLQLGKGFVFTLFEKKAQFIKSKIVSLEAKLETVKDRLEATNKEHLSSLQELDLVKTDKAKTINAKYRRHYNPKEEKASLDQLDTEYATRKQAIEDRDKKQVTVLEAEAHRLQSEIFATKNGALHEIITRDNIVDIFAVTRKNEIGVISDFKSIRGNSYFALLKYLIRNGYIDESYADYMTYFYEHSLSRTDKIFLRSIADQIMKEPDYALTDPRKIVDRLSLTVFGQPEVLNYDLLFYLLKICATNKKLTKVGDIDVTEFQTVPLYNGLVTDIRKEAKMLCAMMEQILSQEDDSFLQNIFLSIRDERLNYIVNMINAVHKEWLVRLAIGKVEFASSCQVEYVYRSLIVTPNDDLLEKESITSALSSFISSHAAFLDTKWLSEESLVSMFGESYSHNPIITLIRTQLLTRFKKLGVRFHTLNHETADAKLFEQVYQHSLYKLNYDNISLMLMTQYNLAESDDFRHKNYSLIKSKPDTPLDFYVEENINDYLIVVLESCEEKIFDEEVDALAILNNDTVAEEHKLDYIAALTTVIQQISSVADDTLWIHLLTTDLVAHTEQNVMDYYCAHEYSITDEMVEFLNRQNNSYNYTEARTAYDDEVQSKFFNSILRCNRLKNPHYKTILKTLNRVYSKGFSVDNIADDKIILLIDIGVIPMNKDSLIFLREHYPNAVLPYIRKSTSIYVSLILDDDVFDLDEAMAVLLLKVKDEHKIALLCKIDDSITARRTEYSDAVKAHILANNLNEEDISLFISSYSNEGALTKASVEKIALAEIQKIFDNVYSIDKSLANKLISADIPQETKQMFFALLLPDLSETQCKGYLSQLGLQDYLGLFEQKRPKIEITPINTRLLEVFHRKKWIKSFDEDIKENGYYRAYGRKAHKEDNTTT